MPYPGGAPWLEDPGYRPPIGQDHSAHGRPGLSPPTPLPTAPLRPYSSHQTGDSDTNSQHRGARDRTSEEDLPSDGSANSAKPQIAPSRPGPLRGGADTLNSQVDKPNPGKSFTRNNHNGDGKVGNHKFGTEIRDNDGNRSKEMEGFPEQTKWAEDGYPAKTRTVTPQVDGRNGKPAHPKKSGSLRLKRGIVSHCSTRWMIVWCALWAVV